MKKIILPICLQILFCFSSNAQITMRPDTMYQHIFTPIGDAVSFVNCNQPFLPGCNRMFNPELATNSAYDGDVWLAFNNGYVDNWSNSHGTPDIQLLLPPPSPGINGAHMDFNYVTGQGEGIVGKIKTLTHNQHYNLSFFQDFPSVSPQNQNEYNIYLMHCSDAPLYFNPMSYSLPNPPPHSQQIYCQTGLPSGSAGWTQATINFIPGEDYDMIWVFPRISYLAPNNIALLQVGFAYPEIISTETFTAGPPPSPSVGNCIVSFGPNPPNPCSVKNVVYTWYDPSGTAIQTSSTNQSISNINTSVSSNVGLWTLEMSVPGANFYGYQNCNNPLNVRKTVYVPPCYSPPCTTPPTITPGGPITKCDFWEAYPSPITLTTNISYGIQWYKDGIIIPGANLQTYDAADGGAIVKTHSYTVKNTNGNCESSPVIINFVPYPAIFPNGFCRNSPITISTTNYGVGATYSWNVPGSIITPNTTSNPIQVTFPTTYTNPYFDMYLTATNSYGCNGSDYLRYPFNNNCLTKNEEKKSINLKVSIFPNPAVDQITLTSKENITEIEISDLLNLTLKRIRLQGAKSRTINISSLNEGFYNCKITTTKGVEYQKLLIKR